VTQLDPNILILLPELIRREHPLVQRVLGGEAVSVCAPVWYEFLIGPVSPLDQRMARAFLRDRILPTSAEDAQLAADFFNHAGRRRSLKMDALIAACAVRAQAELFTVNTEDFAPFTPRGLRLSAIG